METKINIAELLKDCPKGMELDCAMYEDIEFDSIVDNDSFPIRCCVKNSNGEQCFYSFTKYGCWNHDYRAKCVIFPKGKTAWEGFQRSFKDGDILISGLEGCENNPFIFKKTNGFGNAQCYCAINCFERLTLKCDNWTPIKGCRLATEEEKQKLFNAIKANGYKWNAETKTLEKLIGPKFKVGDRIRLKENHNYIYTITGIREENKYECGVTFVLRFSEQDNWELAPNKFDITTLKPFDEVLVRTKTFTPVWTIDFYDGYQPNVGGSFTPFGVTSGRYFQQCIPYKGNEHLRGTTDDCDDFYKTWI